MKIACQDCKNLTYTNMIDTGETLCKFGHRLIYELHECKDGNPRQIPPSEDYKRGFLHGYNTCRREVIESVSKYVPDVPKEVRSIN